MSIPPAKPADPATTASIFAPACARSRNATYSNCFMTYRPIYPFFKWPASVGLRHTTVRIENQETVGSRDLLTAGTTLFHRTTDGLSRLYPDLEDIGTQMSTGHLRVRQSRDIRTPFAAPTDSTTTAPERAQVNTKPAPPATGQSICFISGQLLLDFSRLDSTYHSQDLVVRIGNQETVAAATY